MSKYKNVFALGGHVRDLCQGLESTEIDVSGV